MTTRSATLISTLEQLESMPGDGKISIGELIHTIGEVSFAPLLILPAIALVAMPLVLLFASFPPALIAVVAGVALLGPFIGSLSGALASGAYAAPAAVTFVVTASGLSLMGIGAAFWGLVAGLLLVGVEAVRARLRRV